MIRLLEIFNNEMSKLNVDYHYVINKKENITYPYVVGRYDESFFSFEDGRHEGQIYLDCWNRGSELELLKLQEIIANNFDDFSHAEPYFSCNISYSNTNTIDTTDSKLQRKEIVLDVSYWEARKE